MPWVWASFVARVDSVPSPVLNPKTRNHALVDTHQVLDAETTMTLCEVEAGLQSEIVDVGFKFACRGGVELERVPPNVRKELVISRQDDACCEFVRVKRLDYSAMHHHELRESRTV